MSFLTDDEMREYKQGKKFFGFEGVKLLILILILSLVIGLFGLGYKATIGKLSKDVDREVFEHSKSYVHGMVDDLAKYKFEYAKSQDNIEKQAIREVIFDRYANFDADLIEDYTLRQFLINIRNGGK